MLLELLPDLVRDKLSITQLFGLYKLLVEKWLQRERDWIQEEELLNISMEIAVVLFIQQRAGKGDRISSSQLELIASNHSHPLEAWKLKSRSLLNRDIRGDYKFAHRSVMEYLFLQSAICGDVRCFGVEWTDFMKDLLVSWGNTDANSSKEATKEFFKNDLGATGLFPLASPLKTPYRRSSGECKSVLRNEYISNRHTRNIPVSWRNNYLEVKKLASTGEVYAYQITDPTHGLVWLINDTSRLVDSDERDLYRDSFYLHDSDSVSTNQAIRGKRLP